MTMNEHYKNEHYKNATIGNRITGVLRDNYKQWLLGRTLEPGDMHCYIMFEGQREVDAESKLQHDHYRDWQVLHEVTMRIDAKEQLEAWFLDCGTEYEIKLPFSLTNGRASIKMFLAALEWLLDDYYADHVDQERDHGHRFQIWLKDRHQPELKIEVENDKLINVRCEDSPK